MMTHNDDISRKMVIMVGFSRGTKCTGTRAGLMNENQLFMDMHVWSPCSRYDNDYMATNQPFFGYQKCYFHMGCENLKTSIVAIKPWI
jgi:hypothetical protein